MTELKTLKEIIQTPKEDAQANILVNQLKQEAIKWIEKFENNIKLLNDKTSISSSSRFGLRLKMDWIKHFFNITEEDLK